MTLFPGHSLPSPPSPGATDRMVIFFIALLLLCFSISNISTRIFVSVMSVMMAPLVVGCVLTSWRTSDDSIGLWHDSLVVLRRSRDGVLTHLKHFALGAFRLHCARPTPHPPDDDGSTHSMTERQDRITV
ncbi:hypothetical protein BJV78DRAFT_1217439 [Lactifluus subvellereus]|nr:hypothetical protein BJV78DRAFT_1217439 [Lactifluus subvellereus]